MSTKIQFRRGTASQWTSANPILSSGETGYETDTGTLDDFWYNRWYSVWTPVYSTSVTEANSISLKRTATTGAQPSLTLSAAGTGFSRIKNVSSSGSSSEIVLQDGGILLNSATKGGYKINNLASAAHLTYTGYQNSTGAEQGVSVLIKSDGTLTTGRAFYKSAGAETAITNVDNPIWPNVGLIGDIIFSTSD